MIDQQITDIAWTMQALDRHPHKEHIPMIIEEHETRVQTQLCGQNVIKMKRLFGVTLDYARYDEYILPQNTINHAHTAYSIFTTEPRRHTQRRLYYQILQAINNRQIEHSIGNEIAAKCSNSNRSTYERVMFFGGYHAENDFNLIERLTCLYYSEPQLKDGSRASAAYGAEVQL